MAAFATNTGEGHLIRAELWSSELKETLKDQLMGIKYCRMLGSEFPDGDTFTIPSIGDPEVYNYEEGQALRFTGMDTGEFQFSVTDYIAAGTSISYKFMQDSYYAAELERTFTPKQQRALAEAIEVALLMTPTPAGTGGQTTADSNTINGAKHRMIGSGTNETLDIVDFAKARYALQKANVPLTNLVAFVDPTVEHALATQANLVNFLSPVPKWNGVVDSGLSSGMKFITNIYGFDVYTSNWLHTNTASEAIDGVTAAAGVNNLFFSADAMVTPMIGQIRQPPRVQYIDNVYLQQHEYAVTCRFGFKLFRPENMVIIVTDTDQVYA